MLRVFGTLTTFVSIVAFLCNGSSAQVPHIPCPDIFEYGYDGSSYFGIVTLRGLSYGVTTLTVELSQPGVLNSDYSGKLSLNFNKDKIFDYIRLGTPVTYRVDFPLRNVIPRITNIVVNGNRLCSGPKFSPPSATINLEHTIRAYSGSGQQHSHSPIQMSPSFQAPQPSYTDFIPGGTNLGLDVYNFFRQTIPQMEQQVISQSQRPQRPQTANPFLSNVRAPASTPVTVRPPYMISTFPPTSTPNLIYTPPQRPIPPYRSRPVDPDTNTNIRGTSGTSGTSSASAGSEFMGAASTFTYLNRVCGKENSEVDVHQLAVRGEVIAKSRFPWIVAIYTRKAGSLNFQCGGSLISSRTVISAAHCFQQGTEEISAENLILSIGRHNLNDWQNAENIEADKLVLHPDWKPEENFDADIAIINLKRTVRFNHNIRPVCLWQGPIEVNQIEGTAGIVVGWGVDETNTGVSSVPKLVNTTIVSELTCIRSNERFYYLTSNRTLCAGNRDGSGPCMGDSGSGLMIKNGNKWMLRGSVSASLASSNRSCNLDEFVVYCDIAKFLQWIKSNMFL